MGVCVKRRRVSQIWWWLAGGAAMIKHLTFDDPAPKSNFKVLMESLVHQKKHKRSRHLGKAKKRPKFYIL